MKGMGASIRGVSLTVGVVVWLLVSMPLSALSADPETLFQKKCGQCHYQQGQISAITPSKYAAVQWARFFAKNKHRRKKDIKAYVSAAELVLIEAYLTRHAADSDRPIAAGLR